jgi:glucokinase
MKSEKVLALDIGGTKLAAAVFEGERMLARRQTPTHAEQGPDVVFERIARLLDSLLAITGEGDCPKNCGPSLRGRRFGTVPAAKSSGGIACIGVGCGGPLDSETGIIYSPPNLPGWDAYPLKAKLEARFDVPAFVENDANAAALAEHQFGSGKGFGNLFYITASTGIGSGIILGGKLYRGANYSAGEFGHIVLAPNGPRCNCGGRGCLEALASGTAIAKRALREVRRSPDSALALIAKQNGAVSARDVASAAKHNDPLARKIFTDAACHLGLGITSVIHLLNPEIVIIGGGLAKSGPLLFEPVRQVVKARAQQHLASFVKIVPAMLGKDVGLYGTLAVAREKLQR